MAEAVCPRSRLDTYQGTSPFSSWKVPVGPSASRVAIRTTTLALSSGALPIPNAVAQQGKRRLRDTHDPHGVGVEGPQGRGAVGGFGEQLLLAVAELEAERVFEDQEPYLSELTSRAAWEAWRDLVVKQYRDQGLHCPLGVLIADVGRYSPAAQAVSAQLVRRWQECVRAGIEATQAAGEADPALDADRTAAAVIAAVQGGVTVLLSTGSAEHLEAGLNLCLDHLLS
ncbi:TetR family transcriptional regulator C-terminal domain-containing protein [Actinoallomurus rhizosphaericola]|uniref:TetR family transcriptional regulator C-terminal domain-containing protein n=1 Tax=Actinoallomurus rhizosphaericola TaxID=2952536 RepID=UPI002092F959|nr:hypothetical protein [Actinoallomurus rhizosphaericola]MCO5999743.1 hypothetical protein [Actinoallomurus rhizosphaericola]